MTHFISYFSIIMKSEVEFYRNPDVYNMLIGLGNQNASDRDQHFKIISRNIDSWFLGFGSPNVNFMEK